MTHDVGPAALNAPSHIPAMGPVCPLEPPLGSISLEQQAAPNAPGHTPTPTPAPELPAAYIALEEQVISASSPPSRPQRGAAREMLQVEMSQHLTSNAPNSQATYDAAPNATSSATTLHHAIEMPHHLNNLGVGQ
jgi:hypothetical protein